MHLGKQKVSSIQYEFEWRATRLPFPALTINLKCIVSEGVVEMEQAIKAQRLGGIPAGQSAGILDLHKTWNILLSE